MVGDLDLVRSLAPTEGAADTITTGAGHDIVIGGRGGDTITAGDGDNVIFGDNGEATWLATIPVHFRTFSSANSADDIITTGSGNDTILAGAGADLITAGDGDNTIFADEGELEYDAAGNLEHLLSLDPSVGGVDRVTTGNGRDIVVGGKAEDVIDAGDGDNLIFGDNGEATWLATVPVRFTTLAFTDSADDVITTGAGDDTILAGGGADVITAGDGNNTIFGDEGELTYDAAGILEVARSLASDQGDDDEITSGSGHDIIFGGTGLDVIVAGDGDNLVFGDNGRAEWLAGVPVSFATFDPASARNDTITTGNGNDTILAGAGADVITAGDGNNTIFADEGELSYDAAGLLAEAMSLTPDEGDDDIVITGSGKDLIIGGFGQDDINAGDGDNVVLGDNGNAVYSGGLAVLYQSLTPENSNDDIIETGSGADVVIAGQGADTIRAGDGNNIILGDEGMITLIAGVPIEITSEEFAEGMADVITSGSGRDLIIGGHGADRIEAGDGDNVVIGDNGVMFLSGGVITSLEALSPSVGAVDFITTGSGHDVIMAGVADDEINAGDGDNVVAGDHATITFLGGSFATLTPTTPEIGGNDVIRTGSGQDRIVGGTGADWIDAGDGHNVVVGDHAVILQPAGLLARVESVAPAEGDVDLIFTGAGNDLIIGGTGGDTIHAGAGNDLVFGDHALVTGTINLALLPLAMAVHPFTFVSVFTQNLDAGGRPVAGDDVIFAGAGDDIVFGQQGDDIIFGAAGDDDLVGGHNVAGGQDGDDVIDAGAGFDVIAGDNASVLRTGDNISLRLRVLAGTAMFDERGNFLTLPDPQAWPFDVQERAILILDHAFDTDASLYGVDHLVGGAGDDMLFGQLGDDFIHGDAFISVTIAADGTIDRAAVRADAAALFATDFWVGADTDGDDYIEGGGGADLIFGGLGQDDIAGGSSSLYGLTDRTLRPDGADTIYGGNGTAAAVDDEGDLSPGGRSRDADVILGDNANIIRLVGINGVNAGAFLSFGYAVDGTADIIVRGFDLLDYTVPESADDIGGNDTIYGEAGDDTLHGMVGDDLLYGNGQDDNLYGGNGDDFIEGGMGDDAISHNDELKGQISRGTLGAAEPGAERLLEEDDDTEVDPATSEESESVIISPPSNLPAGFVFTPGATRPEVMTFGQLLLGFSTGRSAIVTEVDPVYPQGGSEWRIFDAGIYTSSEYGAPSSLQGPSVSLQEFGDLLDEENMALEGMESLPQGPAENAPESVPPSDEPPPPPDEENLPPGEENVPPVEEEPPPPEP
ncbi:MAG: hypothetical protein KIT44_10030 [Opitutaceae bacterium]|nr:hypothetical protein [Opitutaceae bacterium]